MLGIHPATLRRWEAVGKVAADRTPAGHRRYDLQALTVLAPKNRQTMQALKEAAEEIQGRK